MRLAHNGPAENGSKAHCGWLRTKLPNRGSSHSRVEGQQHFESRRPQENCPLQPRQGQQQGGEKESTKVLLAEE